MYPFMNEDAAWQRLQDLQREMENSRLMVAGPGTTSLRTLRKLATRAWLLAGLASNRPPRHRPASHPKSA
jgi:hypothetical protein